MPRSPEDDDAPRWELPVWEEPPSGGPSENVPRWEPDREVRRAAPRRGAVPGGRVGVRLEPPSGPSRAAPAPPVSLPARPFVAWAAHPWIVVWALVFLTPGAALALRALDESGFDALVRPLTWAFAGLFVVALALAMVTSARRSMTRLAFGTIAVLAAGGVLLWPMTKITLGRGMCPPRAGTDLGAPVAAAALAAWQGGAAGHEAWSNGQVDPAWRERSDAARLLEYQFVETGCWERVAPIDASRTWHAFRVTLRTGEQAALSKSVVVHTAVGQAGWKITGIEGPLP